MGATEEAYQCAIENRTLQGQMRIFRASVLDFMLLVGEPMWKFIKRHPRLYWLWNKSEPLILAICWFVPFDWEK